MENKIIDLPSTQKVEGITNEAYYYNVAVALAKDLRRAKGEFNASSYLRISFDFCDKEMNPVRKNLQAFNTFAVPLNIQPESIHFVDRDIVTEAVLSLLKNLIQSGSINHLVPEIQDVIPKQPNKNDGCNNSECFVKLLHSDGRITYKDEIDRLHQVPIRLSPSSQDKAVEHPKDIEKS